MSVTAEGLLSQPLAYARVMIARSAAFQAWTGAADETAALAQVHLLHSTRKPTLPMCLLDLGDQFERSRTTILNGASFESLGQIIAYFRDVVDPGADELDATYAFTNRLGAVWRDLEALAGTPGLLGITNISLAVPPTRIEPDRRQHAGDLFEAALACTFRLTP